MSSMLDIPSSAYQTHLSSFQNMKHIYTRKNTMNKGVGSGYSTNENNKKFLLDSEIEIPNEYKEMLRDQMKSNKNNGG